MERMHAVSVIVAESGSEWLAWAHTLRRCAGHLLVLAQNKTEDSADFTQRVSERIARLTREGVPVRAAAYVSGDGHDARAKALRSRLLRRLSAVLTGSGDCARLYLDAPHEGRPEARTLMQALAWALSDLTQGSGLSVRVGAPGAA
jgi:hypothetical protein